MKAKISNFLQSDVFILLVALLMGFLCHFFVMTEILASDEKERENEKIYSYYASSFSRSLSVPDGVDQKKAEIIKDRDWM